MAVYKVPQDVEAEDKLIGPFSFRQFIYLIIAALGMLMGYLLSKVFVGLLVIPLPVIILFLALALPLRKDQPMETYLLALVRFYLKPHRRMWQPDGAMGLVQITAPRVPEQQLTKDFNGYEAAQRLGYLAQVADTRGWSTRGVTDVGGGSMSAAMIDDVAAEAEMAEDVMDEGTGVARNFGSMIQKTDTSYKQSVMEHFQQAIHEPQAPAQEEHAPSFNRQFTMGNMDPDAGQTPFNYNPYPNAMHQRVINPGGQPAQPSQLDPAILTQPAADDSGLTAVPLVPDSPPPQVVEEKSQAPSEPPVSPDIMRLASNNDLSISAIAREAHRLEDKDENEVVISLR